MKKLKQGVHGFTPEEEYIPPKEPAVQKHLEWFRGLKLGFMVHWAPVTQIGTMESWPLSRGDGAWSRREIDWTEDMETFEQEYWALNKTFYPLRFRPDHWAKLAKDCGFKYLLFTTKHHDGFCMYDSHSTDYKITAPTCPFSAHRYANVTKELFEAFRQQGLGISAYFSKPDWHHENYWNSSFGPANTRDVNYEIKEHPELWEDFVQFTHQQLREITSEYGKVDVLWLDGGWVRKDNLDQDIRLGEIVQEIRTTTQPHLIVCDRTVGGEYENIVTPEQSVPPFPMETPWETCISLGRYFSFHYDDEYKSAREVIHILLDVVSKGGSLALNITPRPDGGLPAAAVTTLYGLGRWIKHNGRGIYETEMGGIEPHRSVKYTRKKNAIYAFYEYSETPYLPPRIYLYPKEKLQGVTLLRTGETLPFVQSEQEVMVDTSKVSLLNAEYADCFELQFN